MPRKSKVASSVRLNVTARTLHAPASTASSLAVEAPLPQVPALTRLTPLQIALLSSGQMRSHSPLDD